MLTCFHTHKHEDIPQYTTSSHSEWHILITHWPAHISLTYARLTEILTYFQSTPHTQIDAQKHTHTHRHTDMCVHSSTQKHLTTSVELYSSTITSTHISTETHSHSLTCSCCHCRINTFTHKYKFIHTNRQAHRHLQMSIQDHTFIHMRLYSRHTLTCMLAYAWRLLPHNLLKQTCLYSYMFLHTTLIVTCLLPRDKYPHISFALELSPVLSPT